MNPAVRSLCSTTLAVSLLPALSACSWLNVEPEHPAPNIPQNWHADPDYRAAADSDWLHDFDDPALLALAERLRTGNQTLAEQRAELERTRLEVRIAGADRWPRLSLALNTAERQIGVDFTRSSSVADVTLEGSWELDLWGRLSDAERAAVLDWEAHEARYADLVLETTAELARQWFTLLEAGQLVTLIEERLVNLRHNLATIEDGYRLGLNASLDVYLARNQVEQEAAGLAARRQARDEARRSLELLLGDYPSATLEAALELPAVPPGAAVGIPADVVSRRADIRAAWLALLAADSAVAVARKERFPRLTLTANVGRSALELIKLASDSSLVWSLAAGVTQPVFEAGRLAVRERQARAGVVALEQAYLRTVFSAFGEVEQALGARQALGERHASFLNARTNARAAEELAFEQYRQGLTDYATVLEAERRAFDAETEVVALRAELLRNHITLHQALGGAPLDPR